MRLFLVMTAMLVTMCFVLSGCASVQKEDLDAWEGAPVTALDAHPIFLTMPVVRTKTSDGTEIRNYVNSANVSTCTGGGGVRVSPQQQGRFSGLVDTATYSEFSNCMQRLAACNNIFYIKDDRIQQFTAIGTGGMRCYTNEKIRPGFRGSTNIQ